MSGLWNGASREADLSHGERLARVGTGELFDAGRPLLSDNRRRMWKPKLVFFGRAVIDTSDASAYYSAERGEQLMRDEKSGAPQNHVSAEPADTYVDANLVPPGYMLASDSPDYETGEIIVATLTAAGIHAVMQNPNRGPASNALPFLGNTWSHAVYVPPGDLEAARTVLSSAVPTEEELTQEQAADPTTLEEAERSVRDSR